MEKFPDRYNLLSLPTGGGKTVIFRIGEALHFEYGQARIDFDALHRIVRADERMLTEIGIPNKIINSKVKELDEEDHHWCSYNRNVEQPTER